MQSLKLTIRETINAGKANAERVKIGDVEIYVPTKDEILPVIASASIAQAEDDNGKKLVDKEGKPVPASDEDGYPVYEDPKANWLFGAIITAVKAQARSRLQNGDSAAGTSTTLEELATAAGRDGGAALAAMRECREEFAKWAATTGKSCCYARHSYQIVQESGSTVHAKCYHQGEDERLRRTIQRRIVRIRSGETGAGSLAPLNRCWKHVKAMLSNWSS